MRSMVSNATGPGCRKDVLLNVLYYQQLRSTSVGVGNVGFELPKALASQVARASFPPLELIVK